VWDSTFASDSGVGFDFGEQDEIGLGVRVATPLAEKGGYGPIFPLKGYREQGILEYQWNPSGIPTGEL
jgi:hypothetical protein